MFRILILKISSPLVITNESPHRTKTTRKITKSIDKIMSRLGCTRANSSKREYGVLIIINCVKFHDSSDI